MHTGYTTFQNTFGHFGDMELSFLRRVSNITLYASRPLSPLFEAIANSIHSTQDASINDAHIKIFVVRDTSQAILFGSTDTRPVIGFEIEDNGIGFNPTNFRSFGKSDSDYKPNAKGIGRLLWLKAFDDIKIESVYTDDNGSQLISFDFQLTEAGVENKLQEPTQRERKTVVKLHHFKPKYLDSCPKHLRLIADKIIEHFLICFLSGTCPVISISDEKETFILNDLFEETIKTTSTVTTFNLADEAFQVIHLRRYGTGVKNDELHFCAGDRSVVKINLDKKMPNLSIRLVDDDGKTYRVVAYVQSTFLDNVANAERTDFDIEKTASEFAPNDISFDKIENAAIEQVKKHLEPVLKPIAETKLADYTRYVREEAPEFRTLIKLKPELIEGLPAGLTNEKLDAELHKLKFTVNAELKEKTEQFIRKDFDEVINKEEYLRIYSEFFSQLHDFNADDLAKYVIHRKSIIQLLEKGLRPTESGKYYPEEFVHNLIFPMRVTSDQVDFEKQNLWLIDERLSFHDFLASDKPLSSFENLLSDSRKEPDIILFNTPIAYAEPNAVLDSIVIVEFKRPMRKGYDEDEENPVMQVTNVIEAIKGSKMLDKNGRPIDIDSNTPFYVYIVCDLTDRIKKLLTTNHGFTPTPDPRGYFAYYQPLKAYIEVVSYNKMLDDAKKRNRALFTRLNLPPA